MCTFEIAGGSILGAVPKNVAVRCKVAPSSFKSDDSLAHVALPVGPECYFPPRERIGTLIADVVKDVQDTAFQQFLDRLIEYRSAISYRIPVKPEEHYCRWNLDNFVETLRGLMKNPIFKISQAQAVSGEVTMVVGSKTTSPEPVLMCASDGSYEGVVSSEAKSVTDSMFLCLAQAVQMASDVALNQFIGGGIPRNEVVVPFILSSWEHFQFGCVYLVEDSFPCAVLLSSILSAAVPSERAVIAKWGVALVAHARSVARCLKPPGERHTKRQRLNSLSSSSSSPPPVSSAVVQVAASTELLYKIIQRTDAYQPRGALSYLMNVFYRLRAGSNECQEAVCFPEGVLGLPCIVKQPDLFSFVVARVEEFGQCKMRVDDDGSLYGYCAGHPIVLYQKLPEQWRQCTVLNEETEKIRSAVIKELTSVLASFEMAGVVHLDIRLPNVFYHVNQLASKVSVKVIDWDDALMIGDPIPWRLQGVDRVFQFSPPFEPTEAHALMVGRFIADLRNGAVVEDTA